ncbi:hypothetical protein GGS20DRAFT_572264 [Poronia punctata]|nr:hypothetical protein GGS20DRAFT_572264 [Poronia punctata]
MLASSSFIITTKRFQVASITRSKKHKPSQNQIPYSSTYLLQVPFRMVHLLSLFSLVALLGLVLAMPPGGATATTSLQNIETSNATTNIRVNGVIPVSESHCMGHHLSAEYFKGAKEKMIRFSEKGHHVHSNSWHAERYPKNDKGVTWYICNCKYFHPDKVPREELDDVERILAEKCGPNTSGKVWSQEWDKGYYVVPTKWWVNHEHIIQICPAGCGGSVWSGEKAAETENQGSS